MKRYYALITGASQGLGKAMAIEMAKQQNNLILVSLPNSGQEELSEFLTKNFNIDVHHLELDLSDVTNYDKILEYIDKNKLQLKYLINNAGILSRGSFDSLSSEFMLKQIEVNVVAPTLLIKLFLKNLRNNSPSGILNVSSLAGYFPLIHKQVYCGTKSYLLSFSKSLRKELKQDQISVTAVCPGGLNTTSRLCYQNRVVGWLTRESVLNPEDAAKIAIMGMFNKKGVIVPGFINNFLMLLDKLLPEFIKDYIANRELNKLPVA